MMTKKHFEAIAKMIEGNTCVQLIQSHPAHYILKDTFVKQLLQRGDIVHHSRGYAVVIVARGARAIILFTDGSQLYSRGIDLIKMSWGVRYEFM